jgi:uncharacterized protein with ParB-like and HNH nuclease domain
MESKNSSGKLLFSIEEIFSDDGFLKEKGKDYFNIPHYQRGYKWEPHNVEKLLDDVGNFEAADGKFYCLQNITIVSNENYFNVIDGQQRLTTLTIILSYLGKKQLVSNKVKFPENSIRKMTNQFLSKFIYHEKATVPKEHWEQFAIDNPDYDLQDISHIFNVYKTVESWIDKKRSESTTFKSEQFVNKLLNDVRIIVNEVDDKTSEEKVFGNLNSKRIPLDGSDLIRAILITRVAKEEGRKENDLKNIVYVNERRVKLGWELDQINNWWGQENVRGYFSKFIGIKSELIGSENKLFNDEKYPINNLYLLYAEAKGQSKLTLELIEQQNNDAIKLYKSILRLHNTLQDWYGDKEIYHYLGFLFNVTNKAKKVSFTEIWTKWNSVGTRDEFKDFLKERMKSYFFVEDELLDFETETVNWYEDKTDDLVRVLIFMDVIHSIKTNTAKLPTSAFTKQSNDIEHIYPRNPAEIKNKRDYIEFLNKTLEAEKQFSLLNFEKKINNENYQKEIEDFINNQTNGIPINSVGNLVLLYNKLNKSISNSIYSTKRSRIIDFHNQGNFIQPHTFKVFVRDFIDSKGVNKDYEYWTKDDIKRNSNYIKSQIENFFKLNSNE